MGEYDRIVLNTTHGMLELSVLYIPVIIVFCSCSK